MSRTWHKKGSRACIAKTVNFYQDEDAALLDWCEDRPEKFSDFVKAVLYRVMAGQGGDGAVTSSGIDAAELRQIVREELGRLQVVAPVSGAELNEGDAVSDSVRDRLLGVF